MVQLAIIAVFFKCDYQLLVLTGSPVFAIGEMESWLAAFLTSIFAQLLPLD